jgi:pilus assembly protein CpaF
LEPLLNEPGVTDVLVNGPNQVFIDRGAGLELTDLRFPGEGDVRRLAQRLAASVGQRLDDAVPFVDARLPGGTRVHAVLGSVASPGTCISLRVPAQRSFSIDDCVASGSVTPGTAHLLSCMIEAKLAFLISGGTGSGKTTLRL